MGAFTIGFVSRYCVMSIATDRMTENPTSWVVIERATGKAVCELYGATIVSKVNRSRYRVVGIYEYLTQLNAEKFEA